MQSERPAGYGCTPNGGRVTKLDTGDNETRQRQFVAPADVTAVRRAEDDPAAAVEMEESGQHTPGTLWAVDEYHYLVSVRLGLRPST